MRFVRENLFYVILAAVVAVGGGAATFYYFNSGIAETLQSRKQVSDQLRDLARQELKVDPNAVEAMEKRIADLTRANGDDLKACLLFNRRNLPVLKLRIGTTGLSDANAFPVDEKRYREQGLYISFVKQYVTTLDHMVDGLMPTTLPTPEEVRIERDNLAEKFKESGQLEEKALQSAKLRNARQGLIYIDPKTALNPVFTLADQATSPAQEKLWEAQVNLWLTDEIVRAIAATNRQWIAEQQAQGVEQKPSVLNSAVKHLESIKITAAMTAFPGVQRSVSRLTQRETCAQYAVVPYTFIVVMPTRHIGRLACALETQNYHTVTNIGLSVVPQAKEGYYYGIEPVMRVQVDGEMLLLADWIRNLMPASLAVQFGKAK